MGISATTKMMTVGTVAILLLGGISMLMWYSQQPEQELPKPGTSQPAQKAATDKRSLSNESFSKMPDDHNAKTQIDEASAQPDVPEENVEMAEVEKFLALLDKMDDTDSSEEAASKPQEKRLFGLTCAEMEAEVTILEEKIRTKLTQCVSAYTELVDICNSPVSDPVKQETAKELDVEWKALWAELTSFPPIIPKYVQYMVALDRGNPNAPGGWLYELQKLLPRRVTSVVYAERLQFE